MTQITIKKTVTEKMNIDVEFPIYRKQILDSSTIFMRVDSPEKEISIHLFDDEDKAEIEISHPTWWGDSDYLLGKGIYGSGKLEFEEAVKRIKELTTISL